MEGTPWASRVMVTGAERPATGRVPSSWGKEAWRSWRKLMAARRVARASRRRRAAEVRRRRRGKERRGVGGVRVIARVILGDGACGMLVAVISDVL
jgi:hypothetical protein